MEVEKNIRAQRQQGVLPPPRSFWFPIGHIWNINIETARIVLKNIAQ